MTDMLGLYIIGDSISKALAGFSAIDTTFDDGYGTTLDLLVDASQMLADNAEKQNIQDNAEQQEDGRGGKGSRPVSAEL